MSHRNKTPLILFGSVDSDPISAGVHGNWSKAANITVTTGQADPLGGTSAVLMNDTVAGSASESVSSPAFTLTPNNDGEAIVQVFLKAGTSTEVDLNLRDGTAAANRHVINVAWSGGVPTATSQSGSGTVFTPVAVGGGWYLFRFSAASIVTGNSHTFYIYPAGTGTGTGSVYAYLQSAILPPLYLDDALSWSQPREGSEFAMSAAGIEDAWIVGTDELLSGEVRWVPTLDAATPTQCTGWDGRREVLWVNAGWKSFLEFGRLKATFKFCPDHSDADDDVHTAYLMEPAVEQVQPRLERTNLTRAFTLIIRDYGSLPFEGY